VIVKTHAYPRAALIGNPSDGYFGKTIAFAFSNFQADVTLFSTPELEILPARRDRSRYRTLSELANDVGTYGYYGGIRLLKATLKTFHSYCEGHGHRLHDQNFSIRYHSSIPPHLGLAGSSAIVTACMRALMTFYHVDIPRAELANLVLSVERDELGIGAGLQDRVAQVYGGLVHMDFDREQMEKNGVGIYTALDTQRLPDLYLAFKETLAEGTEVVHNDLRFRWERGDREVVDAMARFAQLTDEFCERMRTGDAEGMAETMNANYDLRRSIMKINPMHQAAIDAARSTGASAKFTGSGGAIIGTFAAPEQLRRLVDALDKLGMTVIRPAVAAAEEN